MRKYPLILKPVFKDYIWGGDRLAREWGKAPSSGIIAESWELSLRRDALTVVANGEFEGRTLDGVLDSNEDFAGKKSRAFAVFPMLIKLIDSRQNLSVQVHPSDAYALKKENSYGKSEVWFILDAQEGAGIYFGFKKDVDKREILDRIADGSLTDVLNFLPVSKGDAYMIEAGTVHAIGAGITLAEIQQNSDLTYRVYDFGRVGKDGKPRELHIDKALDVMNTKALNAAKSPFAYVEYASFEKRLIADNKYFFVEHYRLKDYCRILNRECFSALTVTEGAVDIIYRAAGVREAYVGAAKGATVFIPAGLDVTVSGKGAEFISATL
ncbi:MAG: class I mannose-6-phosphate isomerase [Clostridiales bacterium]|jgi:mannose-6-phosphate isomerase|nr:class I mannose-6-phosphate isomerase [Clostridiales bacterium]